MSEQLEPLEQETDQQFEDNQACQYEITYKTPDEINLEKIKLLADLACYQMIDEEKTTAISEGGIMKNLFDEEELFRIKSKILEIVSKL